MSRILIDNVTVLTLNQDNTVHPNGWLLTDDDKIAAMGGETFAGAYDQRIDGAGGILLPGFVNTHCHISMMPFRSLGDDCPDRLRRFLFPLENEAMTPRLVYLAAKYGICELLLSGVTTFLDMYYFEDEVARACEELGIRGYLGETIIGQPTCVSPKPYGGFDYQRDFLEKYRHSSRIHPIIAPHGTTTCDVAALQRAHALAVEYDTLFTLHAAEMDYEMAHFKGLGTTPIAFLDQIGALDAHTLLAHAIHATDADLDLTAQRGAAVAHCIASNTKAGKGVAPVKGMLQRGVAVGLGTDGASSGNTLSLFDQMRLFANFHKTANRDRSLFPAGAQRRCAASRNSAVWRPACRPISCWLKPIRSICSRFMTLFRRLFIRRTLLMCALYSHREKLSCGIRRLLDIIWRISALSCLRRWGRLSPPQKRIEMFCSVLVIGKICILKF